MDMRNVPWEAVRPICCTYSAATIEIGLFKIIGPVENNIANITKHLYLNAAFIIETMEN